MKIIVDGDACPGISIIVNIAKEYGLELIIYCDINHYINVSYGEVRIVDSGFQSVDMKVVNECLNNDIVISQDYGVAAICLGKKASVISPKGNIYTNENIGAMLEQRHLSQKKEEVEERHQMQGKDLQKMTIDYEKIYYF